MADIIGRAVVVVESLVDPRSAEQAGGRIGSALKKGSLIGVAALGSLAAEGIRAVKAFEEGAAVSRKLSNVLSNMGKSDAAPQVEKLASALQRQTGVSDDVIKGGQTILATFQTVAESAGKVGGTFERASKAALDLSAAGFGSVSSASTMLGKALENPEKGLTALSKAGVTFSASQKQQIADYLKVNDLAGAQAVILANVEKQVGGTAEAGAKASERLKEGFGEVEESLGGLLADLFDTGGKKSIVDQLADATFNLSDEVTKFQDSKSWKELRSSIRDFGGDVKTVATALGSIVSSMDKLSNKATGSGLLHWLNELDKLTNPVRRIADLIKSLQDSWDRLKKSLGGSNPTFKGSSKADLTALLLGGTGSNAAGVRNYAGGLTKVGEQGTELVYLPPGSDVYSAAETRQIMSAPAAAGDTNMTLIQQFYGPQTGSDRLRDYDWVNRFASRIGPPTAGVVTV